MRILLSMLPAFVVVALYVMQPQLMTQIDHKVYDAFLHWQHEGESSELPVIIDIDEDSLEQKGQWPWPRYLLARLLDKLTRAGVAAVGLDIILSESDRTSLVHVRGSLHKYYNVELELSSLPENVLDNDSLLGETLGRTPAVLGAHFRFDKDAVIPPASAFPVSVAERAAPGAPPASEHLLHASGAIFPLPVFAGSAPVASVNVPLESDGLVRSVPLLISMGDKIYPALSLRVLMRALNAKMLHLYSGAEGLYKIEVKNLPPIMVNSRGFFNVPFRGPGGLYRYISAAKVLDDEVPLEHLRGRVAFVGSTATALRDIRSTSFDRFYPGVEVHAALVDAFSNGHFIVTPSFTPGLQVIAITVAGLMAGLLFSRGRAVFYISLGLILLMAPFAASFYVFTLGYYIAPTYVMLGVVFSALYFLPTRFMKEEKQKKFIYNAFGRYVAPEIVKRIVSHKGDVMTGEKKEVSILFTDLRDFTKMSEHMSPEKVVGLLNRYFTLMTGIVRDHKGTLDKFIGDALMAFWNAPLDIERHQLNALKAVMVILKELETLNVELEKDFGVKLRMGAGINSGEVFVGNMGSNELLDYTIIGDQVNLTSRLEGLNTTYGTQVIVSASIKGMCEDEFAFIELDTINVKGKSLPVTIYQPLSFDEVTKRQDEIALYNKGLDSYGRNNFAKAFIVFDRLLEEYPGSKLYALYKERCFGRS